MTTSYDGIDGYVHDLKCTVRECIDCGCLTPGGPTRCKRCVRDLAARDARPTDEELRLGRELACTTDMTARAAALEADLEQIRDLMPSDWSNHTPEGGQAMAEVVRMLDALRDENESLCCQLYDAPKLVSGLMTTGLAECERLRAELADSDDDMHRRVEGLEDRIARLAIQVGCEDEYTNLHDHASCIADGISALQSDVERLTRERDAAQEEQQRSNREWQRRYDELSRLRTAPGHTCEVPGDGGDAIDRVEYDLRCAGCVALRISLEGPTIPAGSGSSITPGEMPADIVTVERHIPGAYETIAIAGVAMCGAQDIGTGDRVRAALAKRWPKQHVLHAAHCRANKCGGTYQCKRCKRTCGWCNGAADNKPDECDDCWSRPEPPPVKVCQVDEDAQPGDWNVFWGDELIAWDADENRARQIGADLAAAARALWPRSAPATQRAASLLAQPADPNLLTRAIKYLTVWFGDGVSWSEHNAEVVELVEMLRPANAPSTECASPPFRPAALDDLEARGFERANRHAPSTITRDDVARDPGAVVQRAIAGESVTVTDESGQPRMVVTVPRTAPACECSPWTRGECDLGTKCCYVHRASWQHTDEVGEPDLRLEGTCITCDLPVLDAQDALEGNEAKWQPLYEAARIARDAYADLHEDQRPGWWARVNYALCGLHRAKPTREEALAWVNAGPPVPEDGVLAGAPLPLSREEAERMAEEWLTSMMGYEAPPVAVSRLADMLLSVAGRSVEEGRLQRIALMLGVPQSEEAVLVELGRLSQKLKDNASRIEELERGRGVEAPATVHEVLISDGRVSVGDVVVYDPRHLDFALSNRSPEYARAIAARLRLALSRGRTVDVEARVKEAVEAEREAIASALESVADDALSSTYAHIAESIRARAILDSVRMRGEGGGE